MAALTADRVTQTKSGDLLGYPVAAATTIYKGALVCLSAAGYLTPAADTAGLSRVIGVAEEKVDNSAGAAGAKTCRVRSGVPARFAATSITQAMLGTMMYVVDDQTFDDVGTNMIPAGVLVKYESATDGWVQIPALEAEPGDVRGAVISVAVDRTLLLEESGSAFIITADLKVMTLPATQKGVEYTFINGGADGAVLLSVSPAAADFIAYITAVDNKDLLNTKVTAIKGDMAKIVGDGADGWWVTAVKGTWAKEA